MLVTGGWNTSKTLLSSTELLVGTATAWVYSGELPTPRVLLRGANIDQKILMTGEIFWVIYHLDDLQSTLGGFRWSSSDEILEFDPLKKKWKLVDRMIQARRHHAVSTVSFDSGLCV